MLLLLPKANVLLESRLRSTWPASSDGADSRTTSELALVADYELLRDLEKQACERSPCRLALCKRLTGALQDMLRTDEMLAHIHRYCTVQKKYMYVKHENPISYNVNMSNTN